MKEVRDEKHFEYMCGSVAVDDIRLCPIRRRVSVPWLRIFRARRGIQRRGRLCAFWWRRRSQNKASRLRRRDWLCDSLAQFLRWRRRILPEYVVQLHVRQSLTVRDGWIHLVLSQRNCKRREFRRRNQLLVQRTDCTAV